MEEVVYIELEGFWLDSWTSIIFYLTLVEVCSATVQIGISLFLSTRTLSVLAQSWLRNKCFPWSICKSYKITAWCWCLMEPRFKSYYNKILVRNHHWWRLVSIFRSPKPLTPDSNPPSLTTLYIYPDDKNQQWVMCNPVACSHRHTWSF